VKGSATITGLLLACAAGASTTSALSLTNDMKNETKQLNSLFFYFCFTGSDYFFWLVVLVCLETFLSFDISSLDLYSKVRRLGTVSDIVNSKPVWNRQKTARRKMKRRLPSAHEDSKEPRVFGTLYRFLASRCPASAAAIGAVSPSANANKPLNGKCI
jgi:hypothetical protein